MLPGRKTPDIAVELLKRVGKPNWLRRLEDFFSSLAIAKPVEAPEPAPVHETRAALSEVQAEEVRRVLEAFIDFGEKHAFKLKNGQNYQGYPYELAGDHLLMWDSGPMAAKDVLKVPISEIDLNTLSYWEQAKRVWVDAHWDAQTQGWIHDEEPHN